MWLSIRLTPQTPDMWLCRRCAIGRRKRYGFGKLGRPAASFFENPVYKRLEANRFEFLRTREQIGYA